MLWLILCVKSDVWSFVLEISHWMMLHSWVDQMKWIVIKTRHLLRTINIIPMGNVWHTQNIHINKVIGENEKCLLSYGKKNIQTLWLIQYINVVLKTKIPLTSVSRLVGHCPCKPKGHQFNSWSGHMPGWLAGSRSGHIWEATDRCFSHMSMFLSVSLPPSLLSKNK